MNEIEGVDQATERANVALLAEDTQVGELVVPVRGAGYAVATEKVILPIGGMTCATCTAHVQQSLQEAEGVIEVGVILSTERATVEFVPGVATMEDLGRAVADAGYDVVEAAAEAERQEEDVANRLSKTQQQPVPIGPGQTSRPNRDTGLMRWDTLQCIVHGASQLESQVH